MEEENELQEPEAAEPAELAEEADPAPAPEGDEPADPAAEPAHKENKVQKRIDEITRARRQAEQEADYWRKVATGEIQPQQQTAPQPAALPPGLPPKPALDNFDDYDQYVEALGEWSALKTLAVRDHQAAQGKEQQARQAITDSHTARVEVAKLEKYADWDEVASSAGPINLPDSTFDAILDSDQSADIGYHLMKHPAEVQRLQSMGLVQQIKEIARLEMKFKDAAPPVKRISKAPAPISPLGGGGEAVGKDPDKMTDEEWIAYERARVASKGRRY